MKQVKAFLSLFLVFFPPIIFASDPDVTNHVKVEQEYFSAISSNDYEQLLVLLTNPKLVQLKNSNLDTGVHVAAAFGSLIALRILLTSGLRVDERNAKKETPLHLAAQHDQVAILKDLLGKDADPEALNEKGENAFHKAASAGSFNALSFLYSKMESIETPDNFGETALHHAVKSGNCKAITFLMERFANNKAKNKLGWTPLHWKLWSKDKSCTGLLHTDPEQAKKILKELETYRKELPSFLMGTRVIDQKQALIALKQTVQEDPETPITLKIAGALAFSLEKRQRTATQKN